MPDDQIQIEPLRPPLPRGEQGGRLSRQVVHVGVLQLARLIRRASALIYSRASGLSEFEWRVLARVCDMPGLSMNELGVVLEHGAPQVSRTVKRLVGLGLLRRDSVGGGPGVAIHPTAAGETAYAPLVELALKGERELTAGLTPEELKVLDRVIKVMTENAMARLAREQQIAWLDTARRFAE